MIRPFCGAPPPETKKKIRSLMLRLGLRKKDGNVNKSWFGDVQAGSCPRVIPSFWDKQWSFGVRSVGRSEPRRAPPDPCSQPKTWTTTWTTTLCCSKENNTRDTRTKSIWERCRAVVYLLSLCAWPRDVNGAVLFPPRESYMH